MLLEQKIALVTGSDSGIGRAIALELAKEGAAVTINYNRNQAAAEEVRAQIEGAGGRALVVQGNVGTVADVERLVEQTVATFGRLDVMVNNAGVETRTSILDSTEHDFDLVLAVNLKGTFFGTQFAAKQMIKQGGGGRIINISSVHEGLADAWQHALLLRQGRRSVLTRTAGVELAPHGITVVNVGPGAIATPINAQTLADPQQKAALEHAIPEGRVGQPEEVAGLVAWLASDKSAYVTSTTFFIDGGIMQGSVGL